MLDPRTIRALAAQPANNGRDLNCAIAEEGDAHALASLLRHPGLDPEVLSVIAMRVLEGRGVEPGGPDEDPPRIEIPWEPSDEPRAHRPWTLDRALLANVLVHPRTPPDVIERIVDRYAREPGLVLTAAIAANAPASIAETIARAEARSALHDRPWLDLLVARSDAASLAETWSHAEDELLREAAARIASQPELLARLSRDPKRRVRRAVALNPAAGPLRAAMSETDEALEVRACAGGAPHPHGSTQAMRALARGTRTLERGGDLEERVVDAIVEHAYRLDPELSWLAGMVLDLETLAPVAGALAEDDATSPSSRALLAAATVRAPDAGGAEAKSRAELAGLLARAIAKTYVPDARALTGLPRLVAFLAELLADPTLVEESALAEALAYGSLGSDPALAARWLARRASRAPGLHVRLATALIAAANGPPRMSMAPARPPVVALEAAWADASVDAGDLVRLARVVRPRRESDAHLRGRADGTRAIWIDLDADPTQRTPHDLVRVVEALDAWVRVSPRIALVFLAAAPRALSIGGNEVRGFRDGVVASQLQRILRATRGGGEHEPRVARVDAHSDEAGVAIGLLARATTPSDVANLVRGPLRLTDGVVFAAAIEALAAIGRRDEVRPLVDVLVSRRRDDPAALAAWILAGEIDRPRAPTLLAGALDAPCVTTARGPNPMVLDALTTLERRHPGTLERLRPSSRIGQAALVNALARAYPGLVGSH